MVLAIATTIELSLEGSGSVQWLQVVVLVVVVLLLVLLVSGCPESQAGRRGEEPISSQSRNEKSTCLSQIGRCYIPRTYL